MATWDEFAASDPDLASFGYGLLFRLGDGIGFLATVRADGGPRMHPVCLTLSRGSLYLAIPQASPKHGDLRRDPRYMIHAFPADEDAEFSFTGRASVVDDPDERADVAEAAVFATGVRDHEVVFRLDIERADATEWEAWNTPDTRPVRRRWPAR